jgi:hypothetical protein
VRKEKQKECSSLLKLAVYGYVSRTPETSPKRLQEGKASREAMTDERFWNIRSLDIELKTPTDTKKESLFTLRESRKV